MALDEIGAIGGGAGAGGDGAGTGAGSGGGAGTAIADDPAAGGGAGGDGAGAGSGDGGAAGADGGAGGGAEEERLPGEPEDQGDDSIEQDGRKMDQATRDALKKLAEVDPAAAKAAREAYFGAKSVLAEFPEAKSLSDAIREIRVQKATIESLGGYDGIKDIQTEVSDYRNEIDQFAKGDVGLIKQLYESNPEGTMVAARNTLSFLAQNNAKLLDQAILPSLVQRLEHSELPQFLAAAMQHCVDGKGQEAFDTIKKIATWFNATKSSAGEITKNLDKVDPKDQALTEREQALAKKERDAYDRDVSNAVTRMNNVAVEKTVRQLFKDLNMSGEGKRDFTQNLMSRVWAAMKKDKQFQDLAHSIKAKGDPERTAKFISDKFEELLPEIFRQYRDIRYPNIPNKKPAAGGGAAKPGAAGAAKPGANGSGGGGAGAGVTVVTAVPKPDTIDWTKTTDEMYHVGRGNGEAILKGGKRVRWQWETATT